MPPLKPKIQPSQHKIPSLPKVPPSEEIFYSPVIEEFSETDDIFHMSQEGETIILINNEIVNLSKKKPKYRPMNKTAKPGGLLEKLRMAQHKRLVEGCSFAGNNYANANLRKIQVLGHSKFRRRLVLEFKFFNVFELPNLEEFNQRFFMDVPLDFEPLMGKHAVYDVVLDQRANEFIPSHFMYFCKMIKAAKEYW